jgi:hypothetical protein
VKHGGDLYPLKILARPIQSTNFQFGSDKVSVDSSKARESVQFSKGVGRSNIAISLLLMPLVCCHRPATNGVQVTEIWALPEHQFYVLEIGHGPAGLKLLLMLLDAVVDKVRRRCRYMSGLALLKPPLR